MDYAVLAYYIFTTIENPDFEVKKHKKFLSQKDAKGRIYISNEGVNGQMSISQKEVKSYIEWFHSDERFKDTCFKIHESHEHAFERLTIKNRPLVALGADTDIKNTGEHVSPEKWAEMLEQKDDDTILIDVRNDYEWKVGHFEGSELPNLSNFRDFPKYAKDLKEKRDPNKTKVMMCCTGGIRCELYSALMKEEGFKNVYQLEGGIINYGLKQGSKHWKGKLFVFDDRLVVPISEDNKEVISRCMFCNALCESYYNCANMDCNELFIACPSCAEEHHGCCSNTCYEEGRVRPFEPSKHPKPFRRLPHEEKIKFNKNS